MCRQSVCFALRCARLLAVFDRSSRSDQYWFGQGFAAQMGASEIIDRPEYEQGQRAYIEALHEECPYPKGDQRRMYWWNGFHDARTQDRLAWVWQKNGTTFP